MAFLWVGLRGDFISLNGLKCIAGAAPVDIVLLVVSLIKYEQLHAGAMLNPHGPIGLALDVHGQGPRPKPGAGQGSGGNAPVATADTSKGRSSFATLDEVRGNGLWEP